MAHTNVGISYFPNGKDGSGTTSVVAQMCYNLKYLARFAVCAAVFTAVTADGDELWLLSATI